MLVASAAAPASAENAVAVWVRTPGSYGSGNAEPPKTGARKIELDKLPQRSAQRSDPQYDKTAYYRGVLLSDVIAQYAPPAQVDLALLRFRNGMIVPLPFRDEPAMRRLDPMIAVGISASPQGPFSPAFPPLNKQVEGYTDIRQVNFTGNKLVVKEPWHPYVPEAAQGTFSPWTLADSLSDIEFVDSAAYYRQFLPSAEVRPGFEQFRGSCQYCHGVRGVGARFGWDYARPIELHTYRSDPGRLYYHIHYRVEYKASWSQMPALKHITEEQAGQIWRWMKAVSTNPINQYSPKP